VTPASIKKAAKADLVTTNKVVVVTTPKPGAAGAGRGGRGRGQN